MRWTRVLQSRRPARNRLLRARLLPSKMRESNWHRDRLRCGGVRRIGRLAASLTAGALMGHASNVRHRCARWKKPQPYPNISGSTGIAQITPRSTPQLSVASMASSNT